MRSGLGPGAPVGEAVWRVWKVLEGLEGFEAIAVALALGCLLGKWPWPRGACWGRCLEGLEGLEGFGGCLEGLEGFGEFGGFGGFWRVWSVLEGLENFGAFGKFWLAFGSVCGPMANGIARGLGPGGACLRSGLGPGVPVGGRCLEGLEGVWKGLDGFGGFGTFWQAALALRLPAGDGVWRVWTFWKRQLWKPIESHCCGLGPRVPVGEVALALEGACWTRCWEGLDGFGGCLERPEGFGAFWRVLERLECLEGLAGFGRVLKGV